MLLTSPGLDSLAAEWLRHFPDKFLSKANRHCIKIFPSRTSSLCFPPPAPSGEQAMERCMTDQSPRKERASAQPWVELLCWPHHGQGVGDVRAWEERSEVRHGYGDRNLQQLWLLAQDQARETSGVNEVGQVPERLPVLQWLTPHLHIWTASLVGLCRLEKTKTNQRKRHENWRWEMGIYGHISLHMHMEFSK